MVESKSSVEGCDAYFSQFKQVWESNSNFSFFRTNETAFNSHLHDFLGIPTIPLIGKYNRDEYVMDQTRSLIIIDSEIAKDSQSLSAKGLGKELGMNLYLPMEVQKIISLIPDKIIKNKQQPQEKKEGKFKSKDKNYNKSEQEEWEQFEENASTTLPEYHSLKIKQLPVRFVWSIGLCSDSQVNSASNKGGRGGKRGGYKNNEKNSFNKKKEKEEDAYFKNLICHPWVFSEFPDFSVKKRYVHHIPCCIVLPEDEKETSGVEQYYFQGKGINFNELRSEYMSIHLRQESLCFSPNNMRIYIKNEYLINHFWGVFLDDGIKGHHLVVLYWIINGELRADAELIIKQAQTISSLISGFEALLGPDFVPISKVKKVFEL